MTGMDTAKILRFFDETMVAPEKYHQQILISLARIFGYRKSVIWKGVDYQGNLYEPIILNMDERLFVSYLDYYYKKDMFHPIHSLDMAYKKKVLYITDIMTLGEYEESEIYQDLSRKYNIYHNIATYFFDGNRLLGAMSVLRPQNEKGFTDTDARTLEVISRHVSKNLAINNVINNLDYQRRIFEKYSNHSPIGMIIIDQSLYIHYFNPAAREICAELAIKDRWTNSVEQFVRQLLQNSPHTWQSGLIKTMLSPALKRFTVHIAPSFERKYTDRELYSIYLIPDGMSTGLYMLDRNYNEYNLTSREREILELVTRGFSNQEIADYLYISLCTVKTHLQNIFKKTGVANRTSLCNKVRN